MPTARPSRLAIVGGVCAVALALLAALVASGSLGALDAAVEAWVAPRRSGPPVDAARVLATIGGTEGAGILVSLVVLALLLGRRVRAAIACVVAVLGGYVTSEWIKASLGLGRPEAALVDVGSSAFPSGHATTAAALAVVLAIAAARWWATALAAAWMLAMAASRLVLGVHWASDVVGGLLLGTAWAALAWALLLAMRPRRRDRRRDDVRAA